MTLTTLCLYSIKDKRFFYSEFELFSLKNINECFEHISQSFQNKIKVYRKLNYVNHMILTT